MVSTRPEPLKERDIAPFEMSFGRHPRLSEVISRDGLALNVKHWIILDIGYPAGLLWRQVRADQQRPWMRRCRCNRGWSMTKQQLGWLQVCASMMKYGTGYMNAAATLCEMVDNGATRGNADVLNMIIHVNLSWKCVCGV